MEPRELAEILAAAAVERRGIDVVLLAVGEFTPVADYFVIVSGSNAPHLQALAQHIEEKASQNGVCLLHREGGPAGRWILLDYGSVVVHIMHDRERRYYDLEQLWGDAEKTVVTAPPVAQTGLDTGQPSM